MLYKLLVCILLTTSADALEAGPISRRALLGKATAGAFLSSPLAAFARDPLKQASDAAVYDRADVGSLTSARVIQRAETNQLVVGQGTPLPLMAARRPPQTATWSPSLHHRLLGALVPALRIVAPRLELTMLHCSDHRCDLHGAGGDHCRGQADDPVRAR